jgi:hypothetical protein
MCFHVELMLYSRLLFVIIIIVTIIIIISIIIILASKLEPSSGSSVMQQVNLLVLGSLKGLMLGLYVGADTFVDNNDHNYRRQLRALKKIVLPPIF